MNNIIKALNLAPDNPMGQHIGEIATKNALDAVKLLVGQGVNVQIEVPGVVEAVGKLGTMTIMHTHEHGLSDATIKALAGVRVEVGAPGLEEALGKLESVKVMHKLALSEETLSGLTKVAAIGLGAVAIGAVALVCNGWSAGAPARQQLKQQEEDSASLAKLLVGTCPRTASESAAAVRALMSYKGPLVDQASRHFQKCHELA